VTIKAVQLIVFIPVLLQRPLFALQPTLRRNLVKLRIDILRPQDSSSKGDHAGNMNTDGAIAATAKHTVSPHDALHLRQQFSVHLALFLIEFSQGRDGFIRGHVLRILMMRHVQKAAFGAKAAMGAMG
jgi:hypothetical protein